MPDAAASAPRRTASIDGPDPLDIHVGQRLRLRRTMLRRSQDSLARALGVSFQQVQKYERGTNRLGASRLFDVARCLGVPVSFFFEGLDPAALDRRDREVARAPLPAPVDVVP
ncbi:helix-turn-helix domain-containing protein, partial [Roseospira goensis]|uniref:helix-turn-helix domain-containing protein n=1 Tax=Roseospira goensis TaxID=391922 RepID=UPI0016125C87